MLSNGLQEQNIKETREGDERYCSFCGKIITKHDEICGYCGARQMMYPAKKMEYAFNFIHIFARICSS
ncbi:hypothetical protein [Brachyspira sp.]|uniref:zinc ribbon domain-containing protein n=1 Tax=Brachyspira sp. TaxID=1977261 RepID=UPI00261F6FFD|nr:hypothetical protein [Brachyspira sp.]